MAGSKKSKHSDDIPMDMDYGKVPPHSAEVERTVLGAITMSPEAFDTAGELLTVESFYLTRHQLIFSAMLALSKKSLIIDNISLIEQLKADETLEDVGGPYEIVKLQAGVTGGSTVEQNCRKLLEYAVKRQCIMVGGDLTVNGYDPSSDAFDVLDQAEKKVYAISHSIYKKEFSSAPSIIVKTLNIIDAQRLNDDKFTGVSTGFEGMDKMTYGWQPTDLIILAARPSVGKTALALNLAKNAASHPTKPTPVGFFSLEMSEVQCMIRILSAQSEVYFENIQRGQLNDAQYTQLMRNGVAKIEKLPLYIDDTAALNIMEFRSKARRLVNRHGVGLIIIDYLQLMSGTGERGSNREEEICNISRNLKIIDKELGVPIIALSQLSRAVESRKESKMPQLSDLRESGAIEQDADSVLFIYRPEYYDIDSNEQGESTAGETHIRFAKHRNGKLGTIKLKAKLDIQKFEDMEDTFHSNWKPANIHIPAPRSFGEPIRDDDTNPF